jgi:ABC-2 type transport system permease protein
MMFNRRTLAIIKRELRMRLFSRTFILMTLLIPLFLFGIMGIQAILFSISEETNPALLVISETEQIDEAVRLELNSSADVKNREVILSFETGSREKLNKTINELKPVLLDEALTGIIFIPESARIDKRINYYSTSPKNFTLFNKIKPYINNALVSLYFSDRKLSYDDIKFARESVDISGYKITKDEKVEEEGLGNMIALFIFSFLLYMALIFAGSMTMSSVVEEKSTRVIEVMLSSVNSTELMTGKIVGTTIIEVIQMAIWLSPLVLLISTSWFVLPADIKLNLDLSFIIFFLYNYFIALLTFVGLYASVGAIFDNPQDAQSGVWPLLMLIMIPFFIALSLESNPLSPIGKIASMVPFASLIVMPARMTLLHVPAWQIVVSIAINIGVVIFVFWLAGKIYKVAILKTGKKPKWSEIFRWIRAS